MLPRSHPLWLLLLLLQSSQGIKHCSVASKECLQEVSGIMENATATAYEVTGDVFQQEDVLAGCEGSEVNLTCPIGSFIYFGALHNRTTSVSLACKLGQWLVTWPLPVNYSEQNLLNGCHQEICHAEFHWGQFVDVWPGVGVQAWVRTLNDENVTLEWGSQLTANDTLILKGTVNTTLDITCSDPRALFWTKYSTVENIILKCQPGGYWSFNRGRCLPACKTLLKDKVCRLPFVYQGQKYQTCSVVGQQDALVCGTQYNITEDWQLLSCDTNASTSTCSSALDSVANETLTCGGVYWRMVDPDMRPVRLCVRGEGPSCPHHHYPPVQQ